MKKTDGNPWDINVLKEENARLRKELEEAKRCQKENYEAYEELKKRFIKLATSYCYVTVLEHELI